MLVSVILFSVMMIMFAWIVYSIFSTVRPRGRLDESHDADIVWIFHDVRHADVDLQISVRDLEYEL